MYIRVSFYLRAFEKRKQVTLYALRRGVGTAVLAARANLVDLLQT